MSGGCRNRNENKTGDGIIAIAILAIIMMPIVGAYLLLLGKNDKQRLIGMILLVIYCVCWIASKF